MRYQSKRVGLMLTAPEVPRTDNNGIRLCHLCQRMIFFSGGFLKDVARSAKAAAFGGFYGRYYLAEYRQ